MDVEQLQADLDLWLEDYNHSRPHSGKYCFGKTPMQTFLDFRRSLGIDFGSRGSGHCGRCLTISFVRSSSDYYS